MRVALQLICDDLAFGGISGILGLDGEFFVALCDFHEVRLLILAFDPAGEGLGFPKPSFGSTLETSSWRAGRGRSQRVPSSDLLNFVRAWFASRTGPH